MKTKEEILDEFDKLFAIHKGRKWILTEEEAKEVKDFISKIIDEILENFEKIVFEIRKLSKIQKKQKKMKVKN